MYNVQEPVSFGRFDERGTYSGVIKCFLLLHGSEIKRFRKTPGNSWLWFQSLSYSQETAIHLLNEFGHDFAGQKPYISVADIMAQLGQVSSMVSSSITEMS